MQATSRPRPGPEPGRGACRAGEDDLRHAAISAVPTAAALSLPLWALLGLVARWLLG
jgi:hypothetical protein